MVAIRPNRSTRVTVFATIAVVTSMGCSIGVDDLPPVRSQVAAAEPRQPCTQPPIFLTGARPVRKRPTDPGHCLDSTGVRAIVAREGRMGSEYRRALPATVDISPEGRVVEVTFHDPCSGVEFHPGQRIHTCILQAFAEWEFAPDVDECPARYYDRHEYFELLPRNAAGDLIASEGSTGCGG
jgi:hypothetical protein